MYKLLFLFALIVLVGCVSNSQRRDKHQNEWTNIVDVGDMINEIETGDIIISGISWPYIMGEHLVISDYKSTDKHLHLFEKDQFKYVKSIAQRGQGPAEISRIGHIGYDKLCRNILVTDLGRYAILSYNVDSLLSDESYSPWLKVSINKTLFPSNYHYINDTLSIGMIIEPQGNSDFRPSIGRYNMNTGEINVMNDHHPEIKKKRIVFSASTEKSIYVECYCNKDLMTICDLNGNLRCNIYGKNWGLKADRNMYYGAVSFVGNYIYALYSGGPQSNMKKDGSINMIYPTKFIVFDLEGNYIKTLETGHPITEFCYDDKHNRIIMNLNDEIQFAYLNIDEIEEK